MGRRIDIQPDDVLDLGGEVGIGRELEAADLMGGRPCARQIRCTELTLSPLTAAIAGAVQWVTPSGGAASSVRVTTPLDRGPGQWRDARRPGLVAQQPPTPAVMNRSCQRHTHGFDTPAPRITAAVPQPSAVARIIRARQTCFCGLLRSATIALEPSTIGGAHFDLDPLAHAMRLPRPWHNGNLPLDLIH